MSSMPEVTRVGQTLHVEGTAPLTHAKAEGKAWEHQAVTSDLLWRCLAVAQRCR